MNTKNPLLLIIRQKKLFFLSDDCLRHGKLKVADFYCS